MIIRKAIVVLALIVIIILLFLLLTANLLPFLQTQDALSTLRAEEPKQIKRFADRTFNPDTFATESLKRIIGDRIYRGYYDVFGKPEYLEAGKFIYNEISEESSFDPRIYFVGAQIAQALAASEPEHAFEYYLEAEKFSIKAIKIAPDRQEGYHQLVYTYIQTGLLQEALRAAEYALSLSPDSYRSHYYLAMVYVSMGDCVRGMESLNLAVELRGEKRFDNPSGERILRNTCK